MITLLTQTAIAVINDIADSSFSNCPEQYSIDSEIFNRLLNRLEDGQIIYRETQECRPGDSAIYKLTRPKDCISLLDVLEATGEHLNCNQPVTEEMYLHFHKVAPRLGILNQITRTYLSQIKLTDF